jgi:hypothetical protein
MFFELSRHIPILKKFSDLVCGSPPLTFANAPVFPIKLPAGFEAVTVVLAERGPITICNEWGMRPSRWTICLTDRIASSYRPAYLASVTVETSMHVL